MAIDMRRIALAAVQAALNQQHSAQSDEKQGKAGLPTSRAVLIGAGLMTAGRLALKARGSGLLGSLEQRLTDLDRGDGERDQAEDEPRDEDFDYEDPEEPEDLEEPEGEEDDDYEEYDAEDEDEEPEAYEDEDEEEPEAYEDEDEEEPEADYEDEEPEDYEEEEEFDEEEERPAKVRAGRSNKRSRSGSRRGHSRDGTA
jgi:hypothetical protein